MTPMPWEGFRFIHEVTPDADDHPFHLNNLGVAELLFDARNAYVTDGVGLSWQELFDSGRVFAMRRLEINYERQVAAGRRLKIGIKAVLRSRRTLTFDEAAWESESGARFAVARSVHLVVRADSGDAVELPDDILDRFASFEGRRIPER